MDSIMYIVNTIMTMAADDNDATSQCIITNDIDFILPG